MKKEFLTVEVMSAASGFLLTDIDAVYRVCSFVTGENAYTHQLPPRMGRELRAALLAKRPELQAEFDYIDATCNRDTFLDVAAELEKRLGLSMTIDTLTENEHERIDPMSELAEKVSPDKIITIRPSPAPGSRKG